MARRREQRALEWKRVAQAVLCAATVSLGGSLGLGWMGYCAVPLGLAAGAGYFCWATLRDRRSASADALNQVEDQAQAERHE